MSRHTSEIPSSTGRVKLYAGRNKRGNHRVVSISDDQMETLGFLPGVKPTRVGSGTKASAYLPYPSADRIIKLTVDTRDALAAYLLLNLPEIPDWAIPVYGVWDLGNDVFAISAAKGEQLSLEWEQVIDDIFYLSDKVNLDYGEWAAFYQELNKEFEQIEAKGTRDEITRVEKLREALNLVNRAVTGFEHYLLDWIDFHAGNFMMWKEHPVVVDFGMSNPIEDPGEVVDSLVGGAPPPSLYTRDILQTRTLGGYRPPITKTKTR